MYRFFLYCWVYWLVTALLSTAQAAPDLSHQAAHTREQIHAVRQKNQKLQQLLKTLEQERSTAERALKATETERSQLARQQQRLQKEIQQLQQRQAPLQQRLHSLQQALVTQQQLVAIQARAAYHNGHQQHLKLLLNQESPEQFSRMFTYYRYLERAHQQQIRTFEQTQQQLQQLDTELAKNQQALILRQQELETQQQRLAEVQQTRQQLLNQLRDEQLAQKRRLQHQQKEQQRLLRLLDTLETQLAARDQTTPASQIASRPPMVDSNRPLSQAKGQLPWPLEGRLLAHYGTPRQGDRRSTWDGVLIAAPQGTTVHAVYAGRVVFADWLRGAGLLLIIDHGQGYLSLYGHNQSLLRSTGDSVKAGDPIATVGNSGGRTRTALYFAIRENGHPQNPSQWCRTKG